MKMYGHLRKWIIDSPWLCAVLAVAVAGALAVAIDVGITRNAEHVRAQRLAKDAVEHAAKIQAHTLNGSIMGSIALLGVIDKEVKAVTTGALPPETPSVVTRLETITRMLDAEGTFLVGSDGVVKSSWNMNGKPSTGMDVKFRPYYQLARQGQSNVYASIALATNKRALYYAAPVYAGQQRGGETTGAIAIRLGFGEIDAFFKEWPEPALLLTPQGVVFASNRPDWIMQLAGAATDEKMRAIGKTKQFANYFEGRRPESLPFDPGNSQVNLNGRTYLTVASTVDWKDPQGDWTLVLLGDKTDLIPASLRAVLGAVVVLGSLLLAFLLRESLIHREEKRAASARIAEQQAALEVAYRQLEHHSEHLEETVKERTQELRASEGRLRKLVELGIAMTREQNNVRFLEMIVAGAKELTNADGGALYLRPVPDRLTFEILMVDSLNLHMGGSSKRLITLDSVPLRNFKTHLPNMANVVAKTVLTEGTVVVTDLEAPTEFDFGHIRRFDQKFGYCTHSLMAVPLKSHMGEVKGVLLLFNAQNIAGSAGVFTAEMKEMVGSLAAQAAATLDNQTLIHTQNNLLDSIIKMVANAIDAKSPYTAGHCERVPVLGSLLAQAACESTEGPFAGFTMSEAGWREFRLAGWLHDCGKVTVPEYVVDKATKLETIYNRIHEVRTRFEVKLRDCTIEYLRARMEGQEPGERLQKKLEERIAKLQADFAFVAECNRGGEFMDPARIARLEEIAAVTWQRHFDDRLGLSDSELIRVATIPTRPLPAEETLLADKPEQIIPRSADTALRYDPQACGFLIDIPEHQYNHGEIYNLRIGKGTLTEEERFKIIEHVIYTIFMLEQLPFPRDLARVPEFAGAHHETMNGTGYPRKLNRDQMSVQARVLAIADVFEALTASDRPYRKFKTLSEALQIMALMCKDQHIDSDLFSLLLSSGIYLGYAKQFLRPEQIDEVDVAKLRALYEPQPSPISATP